MSYLKLLLKSTFLRWYQFQTLLTGTVKYPYIERVYYSFPNYHGSNPLSLAFGPVWVMILVSTSIVWYIMKKCFDLHESFLQLSGAVLICIFVVKSQLKIKRIRTHPFILMP